MVSPVLFEGWKDSLEKLFRVIDRAFIILPNESAGTHLHVAPVGRTWTLEEIRQLSKGLFAWNKILDDLMSRNRQKYAAWNQWDEKLQGGSVCKVDSLSLNEIVEAVSPNRYLISQSSIHSFS